MSLFRRKLSAAGIPIQRVDQDGTVVVLRGSTVVRINLENVRKEYARTKDASALDLIVRSIKRVPHNLTWSAVESHIFEVVENSDLKLRGCITRRLTRQTVAAMAVQTDTGLIYVTHDMLRDWKRPIELVRRAAKEKASYHLGNATLKVRMISGRPLGYFETSMVFKSSSLQVFKSSILLSPRLKGTVHRDFGWPVLAVVPARDFVYIFRKQDLKAWQERLGTVVVREFESSGYPVSTEIWEISDTGITAVGAFDLPK